MSAIDKDREIAAKAALVDLDRLRALVKDVALLDLLEAPQVRVDSQRILDLGGVVRFYLEVAPLLARQPLYDALVDAVREYREAAVVADRGSLYDLRLKDEAAERLWDAHDALDREEP